METTTLLSIIANGEDSYHQFKANMTNANGVAAELVAFSNANGGSLIIGVNDDGTVSGLNNEDIARLNQLIANAATNCVKPAINPITENIALPDGLVLVVTIEVGLNKPYMDNQGHIWTKNGADKRKITAREDLQRLFQQAALIHADETPVTSTNINDVDEAYFDQFFSKEFDQTVQQQDLSRAQLMANMNLVKNDHLNIAGTLLFATAPYFKLPNFIVKAVAFEGDDIIGQEYNDSRDIKGKLADIFQQTLSFIIANLRHTQNSQNFNSTGAPEIPRIVFEELCANALIHRDYFVSAPVRVLIFTNRIEIISPGHLPNNLTIENIKMGNSNIRNPILASYAAKLLPYRGLGSGIKRALKEHSAIDLIEDKSGNTFKVVIWRL